MKCRFKPGDLVRPRDWENLGQGPGPMALVEQVYVADRIYRKGQNVYVKLHGYGISFHPHELEMVRAA